MGVHKHCLWHLVVAHCVKIADLLPNKWPKLSQAELCVPVIQYVMGASALLRSLGADRVNDKAEDKLAKRKEGREGWVGGTRGGPVGFKGEGRGRGGGERLRSVKPLCREWRRMQVV